MSFADCSPTHRDKQPSWTVTSRVGIPSRVCGEAYSKSKWVDPAIVDVVDEAQMRNLTLRSIYNCELPLRQDRQARTGQAGAYMLTLRVVRYQTDRNSPQLLTSRDMNDVAIHIASCSGKSLSCNKHNPRLHSRARLRTATRVTI